MRDILILVGLALASVVVGAMVFFLGDGKNLIPSHTAPTNTSANVQTQQVSVMEIMHGSQSSVTTPTNYVVSSTAQLSELWQVIGVNESQPSVDFSMYDVLAVFAGNEPTAGYSVAISKVTDSDKRMVEILLTKPGGSCILAQARTTPYQIVKVPKSTLPLSHTDVSTTTSCLN